LDHVVDFTKHRTKNTVNQHTSVCSLKQQG